MVVVTRTKAAGSSLYVVAGLAFLLSLSLAIFLTIEDRSSSPLFEEIGKLANRKKIYIAANYYNNERILPTHLEQILSLIALIRKFGGDVFVSVYENGSKDATPVILDQFRHTLRQYKVEHRIQLDNAPTWRQYQNRTRIESRIKFMASIRNRLLEPLSELKMDYIMFFNDVIFDAQDAFRLFLTKRLEYDAVCAMDFNRVTLYDTWVARDVNGFAFAPFYPYVSDETSRSLLEKNQPFPVISCWNGIMVVKAAAMANVKFRLWTPGESRSARYQHQHDYGSHCPVSECSLLFKDLSQNGYSKFYINPDVRVTYSRIDWFLYWVFGGALNRITSVFMDIERRPRLPEDERIPSCDIIGNARLRLWAIVIASSLLVLPILIPLTLFVWQRRPWQNKTHYKALPKDLV